MTNDALQFIEGEPADVIPAIEWPQSGGMVSGIKELLAKPGYVAKIHLPTRNVARAKQSSVNHHRHKGLRLGSRLHTAVRKDDDGGYNLWFWVEA